MKTRAATTRIIFHHSLSNFGNVEVVRQWHVEKGYEDIGYHFVVRTDGVIEEGRDLGLVGAHALGKNGDSIGVCLIGNFHKTEPTPAQIETAQELYHALCRQYGKTLKVEFHRPLWYPGTGGSFIKSLNPCPGPKLDRDDFLEIVKRGDPFGNLAGS